MKRLFFLATTLLTGLTPVITLAATAQSNLAINITSSPSQGTGSLLPSDRDASANWALAGMQSEGGIPNRTTQCGATLRPRGGGQDDTTNIQNAVNACPAGDFVNLAAGTFTIAAGSYVLIDNGITLRGAGAGTTILTHPGVPGTGGSSPLVILGPARFGPTPGHAVNLSADAAKGATTITLNCGGNCSSTFAPGIYVLLDELSGAIFQNDPTWYASTGVQILASPDWQVVYHVHNPSWGGDAEGPTDGNYNRPDRNQNEIKEIAAVSSNTITFTSPLTKPYRVSHTAQLSRFDDSTSGANVPNVKYAGLEKVSLLYGDDCGMQFILCSYCWAKDVENSVWQGVGIDFIWSFRDELDEFYSHDAFNPQPTGGAYAIGLDEASSEILIQDGISVGTNKVMVARGAGAGSVVAYNYMDIGLIDYQESWIEIGLNASHFVGSHHVLFEGNYGFNADGDFTHGNATNMTLLRNWLRGVRHQFVNSWTCGPSCSTGDTVDDQTQPDNGPARAAGTNAFHYWYSWIGNVLGVSGLMSGWQYQCDLTSSRCVWAPGWGYSNNSGTWGSDPQTISSSFPGHWIRDGNWDWVTNSQRWDDTPVGIPNSFYLSSKPSFMGPNPWPWVDPTTGTVYTLPAKQRFDNGTPNCNC